MNFDVYIQVGDRHIHYIRNSEPFDADRLEKLRTKGVKKMWISMEEEPLYIKYLDMGLDRLMNNSMTKEQKGSFARDSMTTEAENVQRNIQTQAGYQATQKRMEKLVTFLTKESGALKAVMDATGYAMDNFQHSANVSTLSLSLAGSLGVTKPRDLLELGLAALLHDIGKEKVGIDSQLVRENMTPDQLKKWSEHPTAGATLLADKPHIDKAILDMIMYHEENCQISGPMKKDLSKLPLTIQALSLCNEYDRLATQKQKPPKEIMTIFFQEKIGMYDLKQINALGALLK